MSLRPHTGRKCPAIRLCNPAIHGIIPGMGEPLFLEHLNEAQRAAVTDTEGALLVHAGAGSGKTRVLTTRVAYLVREKGVDPRRILAITFTNKAADEMRDRIGGMLGEDCDVWISTFHSMCARILFRECDRIGYGRNFSIYTESESERVLRTLARERYGTSVRTTRMFPVWMGHIKKIKGFNLDPERYARESIHEEKVREETLALYDLYRRELGKYNAMDFDDLLINAVRLFDECPDVLARYADRFRYIHVDEFQDTNRLQYELVRQLSSVHGNLFVVGDEDQSIYGWRGADINNMLDFKKDFPAAKIHKLEENYRSTDEILKAANNVIHHNGRRFDKVLYTSKAGGRHVDVFCAFDDRDEVSYVVRNISDLLTFSDLRYRDVAVLVRANSLTRPFEAGFVDAGIPYRVYGGVRFYERKEIKELLSYIRIALNPRDYGSAFRVLNIPRRGIGQATLEKLLLYARVHDVSLMDAMRLAADVPGIGKGMAATIAGFSEMWNEFSIRADELSIPEFCRFVMDESGLGEMYRNDPEGEERYENLLEFVAAASAYADRNPDRDVRSFMYLVSLYTHADEMDGSDCVTLSTIHAVKGLEFRAVFIAAAEENIFPTTKAVIERGDGVEEERRLMYVAITRARERLYISFTRNRYRFNQRQSNPRSRFVAELLGSAETGPSPAPPAARPRVARYTGSSVPIPRVDTSAFVPGKRVVHDAFGEGIILQTSGEGNEKIAGIEFPKVGIKKIVVAVAIDKMRVL